MAAVSMTFATIPGQTKITYFGFYGARILGVARAGAVLKEGVSPANPGNAAYKHQGPRINFDTNVPFIAGEKVWVLWDPFG